MDFVDFEEKIIAELESELTESTDIRTYPDDFARYVDQLTHPNGAVLIAWQGGIWEPPEGNNQKTLVQIATYNWQINVLRQNLSRIENQYGIYDVIEEIRTILSGFTPAGFADSSVLYPVSAGFLERVHGFYSYQITFGHTIEESEA